MSTAWTTALDVAEADLAAVEAALAGPAPTDRLQPPQRVMPTGPFPAELAPRAEFLLTRTRLLEARAAATRDRIGAELRALSRRHPAAERARTGRVVDVAG